MEITVVSRLSKMMLLLSSNRRQLEHHPCYFKCEPILASKQTNTSSCYDVMVDLICACTFVARRVCVNTHYFVLVYTHWAREKCCKLLINWLRHSKLVKVHTESAVKKTATTECQHGKSQNNSFEVFGERSDVHNSHVCMRPYSEHSIA